MSHRYYLSQTGLKPFQSCARQLPIGRYLHICVNHKFSLAGMLYSDTTSLHVSSNGYGHKELRATEPSRMLTSQRCRAPLFSTSQGRDHLVRVSDPPGRPSRGRPDTLLGRGGSRIFIGRGPPVRGRHYSRATGAAWPRWACRKAATGVEGDFC